MTSSLPIAVSSPLLLAVWLVWLLRVWWFRALDVDRRINLVMLFVAVACSLREPVFQRTLLTLCGHPISERFAFQLSTAAIVFGAGAGYLATMSWLGRRAHSGLLYTAATAAAVAMVWLGRHTPPGDYLVASLGLPTVIGYWALFAALPYWCCGAVIYTCVMGLRRNPDRRDTVMYVVGLALFVGIAVSTTTALTASTLVAAGHRSRFTAMQSTADRNTILLITFVGVAVAAVPVVIQAMTTLNLDQWSRRRRALLPMWHDLTSACPEIVHLAPAALPDRRTRYLLHRTTIEIRDCILILSRFARPEPEWAVAAAARDQASREHLTSAVQLVRAIAAKRRGDRVGTHALTRRSSATELHEETAELIRLAAHWNRAKYLVAEHEPRIADDATTGAPS